MVPQETQSSLARLRQALKAEAYGFVPGSVMADILTGFGLEDWHGFSASWEGLEADTYMADGGRYRKRRHAAYGVVGDKIERLTHRPHFQTRDNNPLNGGVERWFAPVTEVTGNHPAMLAILTMCRTVFDGETGTASRYSVEVHQFRIEAGPLYEGRPSPEGIHRDGVDFVLTMLISRVNVAGGTSTVRDGEGRVLHDITLVDPMDCLVLDDRRVFHGVTDIRPQDKSQPAFRDALVVTFSASEADSR